MKIVDNSKGFIDTQDHWAKDAIDFVSARGLVSGMSATIYAPDASATRAQLWTILARQNDADLTGGSIWYEKAQNWAKEKGISDGTNPNGTHQPRPDGNHAVARHGSVCRCLRRQLC